MQFCCVQICCPDGWAWCVHYEVASRCDLDTMGYPLFAVNNQWPDYRKWIYARYWAHVVFCRVTWQILHLCLSGLSCCCPATYLQNPYQTQFATFLLLQDHSLASYSLRLFPQSRDATWDMQKCSGQMDNLTMGVTLKQCSVKMLWHNPSSLAVGASIAWQVTMHERGLNRSEWFAAIGCVAGGMVGRSEGTGMIPGVLFLVIHLWRRGVIFNVHFAVGLRDCMRLPELS